MTTLLILPHDNNTQDMYLDHKAVHKGDSGIDLFCPELMLIKARSIGTKIDMNVSCSMIKLVSGGKSIKQSYLLIPRSSISKTPLRMTNSIGLIDAGYTGHIIAVVDNNSDEDYMIGRGDRLFQLVSPNLNDIKVKLVRFLATTDRGSDGFGSSGQ